MRLRRCSRKNLRLRNGETLFELLVLPTTKTVVIVFVSDANQFGFRRFFF